MRSSHCALSPAWGMGGLELQQMWVQPPVCPAFSAGPTAATETIPSLWPPGGFGGKRKTSSPVIHFPLGLHSQCLCEVGVTQDPEGQPECLERWREEPEGSRWDPQCAPGLRSLASHSTLCFFFFHTERFDIPKDGLVESLWGWG